MKLTVPRHPVTRRDYVDCVRPLAAGFEAGPDRGTYGPRHALPALAVFALEGDRKLGRGDQENAAALCRLGPGRSSRTAACSRWRDCRCVRFISASSHAST